MDCFSLVRVHDKLRQGEKVLRYFTQQQWIFLHDKILQIEKQLNDADKKIFMTNMGAATDLQGYADNTIIGVKVFLFNEDMKMLDRAKRTSTM